MIWVTCCLSTLNPIGVSILPSTSRNDVLKILTLDELPGKSNDALLTSSTVPLPKVNVSAFVPPSTKLISPVNWISLVIFCCDPDVRATFSESNSEIAALIFVAAIAPPNEILESTVAAPSINVIRLPISVSLEFIWVSCSLIAPTKFVADVLRLPIVPILVCAVDTAVVISAPV